jgi:hypothetical protein
MLRIYACLIHAEKFNNMQQRIKIYYSTFIRSSTCLGRHTAHHQEPETALAASGFAYVEGCWTCGCWTLSASTNIKFICLFTCVYIFVCHYQRPHAFIILGYIFAEYELFIPVCERGVFRQDCIWQDIKSQTRSHNDQSISPFQNPIKCPSSYRRDPRFLVHIIITEPAIFWPSTWERITTKFAQNCR